MSLLFNCNKSKSVKVKLVERESVACHSSGKAGGFLALDWNDHSPVCSLSRLSYKLHEDLNKFSLKFEVFLHVENPSPLRVIE